MNYNEKLDKALQARKEFFSNEEDSMLLDAYEIYLMDQNSRIQEAKEDGRAEGIAEGRAQGLVEGKAQAITEGIAQAIEKIALNMLKNNTDIEYISKVTNLSIEKITKLKKRI